MWVSCLSDPWNHFRKEDCNWCIHEHLSVSHSSKIWRKSTDKWSRRNNQVNASGSCVLTASVVRVSVNTYWLTGCWLIYQLILTQHLKQVLADMSIDSGCLSTYTCHANTLWTLCQYFTSASTFTLSFQIWPYSESERKRTCPCIFLFSISSNIMESWVIGNIT